MSAGDVGDENKTGGDAARRRTYRMRGCGLGRFERIGRNTGRATSVVGGNKQGTEPEMESNSFRDMQIRRVRQWRQRKERRRR
ncbi:uncharacterized protein SPSK_10306 [Sporothrix schenckii 1099-18]|uniref:Uncharacterized protein n=1 Tax=Sporothrix schenckii 1099-18 TaxID=1397361 RepID=A0A0F2M2U5_SPOSC|nr:uncharacterized protein SPSK_10306 [Sporothrix schenckii 1099-18]KJR84017.1 hypothetical protein SPSK_10306 [Sporothrix schenckii 1099-18]